VHHVGFTTLNHYDARSTNIKLICDYYRFAVLRLAVLKLPDNVPFYCTPIHQRCGHVERFQT
jgi:hypothetical protein